MCIDHALAQRAERWPELGHPAAMRICRGILRQMNIKYREEKRADGAANR
jgi:hypothetical protein